MEGSIEALLGEQGELEFLVEQKLAVKAMEALRLPTLQHICRRHGIHRWPGNKQKNTRQTIHPEKLKQNFNVSMVQAAKNLGISIRTLYRICRQLPSGIVEEHFSSRRKAGEADNRLHFYFND